MMASLLEVRNPKGVLVSGRLPKTVRMEKSLLLYQASLRVIHMLEVDKNHTFGQRVYALVIDDEAEV